MAWIALVIAGLFEVGWAIGLKYTEGFTKPIPSLLTAAGMACSFFFLAYALKTIPVGTGYAIWVGIGAAGTAALGILLFSEPFTLARVACIGLILAGVVGLKLASPS